MKGILCVSLLTLLSPSKKILHLGMSPEPHQKARSSASANRRKRCRDLF